MKWFWKRRKLIEAVRTDGSNMYSRWNLKLRYTNGDIEEFEGDSTVWYRLPYMERPGTFKESELAQINKYIHKWGNPYPTAHLTK